MRLFHRRRRLDSLRRFQVNEFVFVLEGGCRFRVRSTGPIFGHGIFLSRVCIGVTRHWKGLTRASGTGTPSYPHPLRLSLYQAPQTKILHYTPTPNLSVCPSPLSNSSERGNESRSRRSTNRSVGVYMVGVLVSF
jgi:hypothetical protein